jgi:hypothetical protein
MPQPLWSVVPLHMGLTKSREDIPKCGFRMIHSVQSLTGFIHKSAVEYYALVRAAELTLQNGRDYFRVLGGDADVRTINVFVGTDVCDK